MGKCSDRPDTVIGGWGRLKKSTLTMPGCRGTAVSKWSSNVMGEFGLLYHFHCSSLIASRHQLESNGDRIALTKSPTALRT